MQGFCAGQLNLKTEVPPGLARLNDPYDPAVNSAYIEDVNDLSYYKGKLYLYFGVTPALVLYWPYLAITGHYLSDKDAVVIFFALGFLVAAGLLRAVWRRYFPEASVGVAVAGLLILGLAMARRKYYRYGVVFTKLRSVVGLHSQCWRWRRSGVHCMSRNGEFFGC